MFLKLTGYLFKIKCESSGQEFWIEQFGWTNLKFK